MIVGSEDSKLEKQAADAKEAQKQLGRDLAKGLANRVKQMEAAESIADLLAGLGKWEPLVGDRKGTYSCRLTANWRLIVEFSDDEKTANLIKTEDYHKK